MSCCGIVTPVKSFDSLPPMKDGLCSLMMIGQLDSDGQAPCINPLPDLPPEALGYIALDEVNQFARDLNRLLKQAHSPPSWLYMLSFLPWLPMYLPTTANQISSLLDKWNELLVHRQVRIIWMRYQRLGGDSSCCGFKEVFHVVKKAPACQVACQEMVQ